jgi:uncharacterized membrane protein YcaP (DUF421 family)
METQELLMTAARAVGVFVLMLVVIRLLGKRTVGNFTAFDLLVALMLGEVVDEMIYGDVTLLQGGVAVVTIAAAKYVTTILAYRNHAFGKMFEGTPAVVVRDGEFEREGMRNELMSEREVVAALRLQGVDDMREVKLATVEVDGIVSVVRHDWAEPVQKADLGRGACEEKRKATGDQDEAPDDKRTDSARYVA